MNNETPDEKWIIQVKELKAMYPFLEAEDFTFDYGMKDVTLNKLQLKLGKNREELNEILDALTDRPTV